MTTYPVKCFLMHLLYRFIYCYIDERFLVTLDELKVGAVIHWAITIGDSGDTHINLHGLPLSKEEVLAKPSLSGDNVTVIQLFSAPIHCRVFDDHRAAGPIPLICLSSQEEVAFVRGNPAFIQAELQKLAACYLKPVFISRQDALNIYLCPPIAFIFIFIFAVSSASP